MKIICISMYVSIYLYYIHPYVCIYIYIYTHMCAQRQGSDRYVLGYVGESWNVGSVLSQWGGW